MWKRSPYALNPSDDVALATGRCHRGAAAESSYRCLRAAQLQMLVGSGTSVAVRFDQSLSL